MVSIKPSSVCHKTWQSGDTLAVWSSLSRGLSMRPDSLYWQWLAWNRSANLGFLLLWLNIWPLACVRFKQPLHSPHRLLYRRLWKINEGGEQRWFQKELLHITASLTLARWGMNPPQSVLEIIYFSVMHLACLGPSFCCLIFFCRIPQITNGADDLSRWNIWSTVRMYM